MKNLCIVGARGFGREICSIAFECLGYGRDFVVKGFLDDKRDALDCFHDYPPILGSVEDYDICVDDVFFVAIGDVRWRRHYAEMIVRKGGSFLTLVHRDAHVGKTVSVGDGVFVGRSASLSVDISVGNHVCIMDCSIIGHDCSLGDFSHVSVQCFLGGGVALGECVTLHPGARVAPHKKIGEGAVVGIGSVVMSNVRAHKTVFGVPAMPL